MFFQLTIQEFFYFLLFKAVIKKNPCMYYSTHVKLCVAQNKPFIFQSYAVHSLTAISYTPFLNLTIYTKLADNSENIFVTAEIFFIQCYSRAGSRQSFCKGTNEILGLWAMWSVRKSSQTAVSFNLLTLERREKHQFVPLIDAIHWLILIYMPRMGIEPTTLANWEAALTN